jgi:hypothetical protein
MLHGMREQGIMHEIMLAIGRGASRIFRNHVGVGYQGKVVERKGSQLVLENARTFTAGLCTGSSDLVGWTSITIEAHHVGMKVAVFTAIEVKAQRGLPTIEQSQFLDAVRNAGGIGLVARSGDEALDGVEKFRARD